MSQQTVADWVQKFGMLLAEAARRYARRVGSCWFVDETGQVMDILLREKRDPESAEAFSEQAIERRGVVPDEVTTDKHRGYLRAMKRHAPKAKHRRTGFHRKRALTTKPVERSHVPVKDRTRPMRSLASVETGQRLLEGIELAQAARRRPPTASARTKFGSRAFKVRGGDLLVAGGGAANHGWSGVGDETRRTSPSAFAITPAQLYSLGAGALSH